MAKKDRLLDGILAVVLLACLVLPLFGIASSVLGFLALIPQTSETGQENFANADGDVASASDSDAGNVRVNPHPKQRCSVCFGKGYLTTRDMIRISEPRYLQRASEPLDPLKHWANYDRHDDEAEVFGDLGAISQRQCLVCEGHGYIDGSN